MGMGNYSGQSGSGFGVQDEVSLRISVLMLFSCSNPSSLSDVALYLYKLCADKLLGWW